jgi:hypothetical protein
LRQDAITKLQTNACLNDDPRFESVRVSAIARTARLFDGRRRR